MSNPNPHPNPNNRTYWVSENAATHFHDLIHSHTPPKSRRSLSMYLDWLAANNPTYSQWHDNRPDYLQALDLTQYDNGQLPLWDTTDNPPAPLYLVIQPQTINTLARLSLSLGIAPTQYVTRTKRHAYRGLRAFDVNTIYSLPYPRLAAYALRAIGNEYLIPHNHPTVVDWDTFNPFLKHTKAYKASQGGY